MEKKMINDDELQDVYDAYINLTAELLESYSPEALAGVMAVQALSMYKTFLSPKDYDSMVRTLFETRNNVKTIPQPTLQ
jgi:hypothetical protein